MKKNIVLSKIEQNPFPVSALVLLILAASVYLIKITKLGIYNDDWYLIYDANTHGGAFFHEVYRSDRPARAYVLQFTYALFGNRILFYHLLAWFYRTLAGVALLWALYKTWPERTKAGFIIAVLFTLYPGFLSQINPIDYQAQLLSLFLAMLSIALTVAAQQEKRLLWKLLATTGAILTGWAYLSLVEYFLGLEALRLVLIAAPYLEDARTTLRNRLRQVLLRWSPFILIPLGFLSWRFFLFESERRATDVSTQIGQLFTSPLTGLRWLITLTQNSVMAIFLAWGEPLNRLAFSLRLRDTLSGLALALLVASLCLWLASTLKDEPRQGKGTDWRIRLMLFGFLVTLTGLLPVITANRSADFSNYSRYLLAGSPGAVMAIVALILLFENRYVRNLCVGLLLVSATLTHHANALQAEEITQNQRDFWWQVAWRAPDIQDGVTLVAAYPVGSIQEDYFVWGPANLIYRSQEQTTNPLEIKISAVVLNNDTLFKILRGRGQEAQLRRGNHVIHDFSNVLILTQPAANACVRALNGSAPELSENDRLEIRLIASASRLDEIRLAAPGPSVPAAYFGPEPAHDWCYYYQKASLARQRGDWEAVVALGEKALAAGHYPADKIEWLPFMQAYVKLGQPQNLRRFVSIFGESPDAQSQTCQILSASTDDPALLDYLKTSFCR